MASDQAQMEVVEKDRVPKMATLFESLAEKGSPSLDEISSARATAQQNSIGAVGAAEKAAAADSGKGVSGYAVKVKDQAAAATHYTVEKVVDVTKTVAGYAKDKVVGAGEKLVAVKDVVVATVEKDDDCDAKEKAEVQKSPKGHDERGLSVGEQLPSQNTRHTDEYSEGAEQSVKTNYS